MAFKLVVLAAALAVANAGLIGAPVGYAAAPAVASYGYAAAPAVASYGYAAPAVRYATPAVGATHESTVRSLDGNSATTTYSKAVDTAFSSVRKYDSRTSNDAQILAHAPVAAYAAPVAHAYAAPAAYAAPVAHAAYAAPVAHAYAAPAAYAAPVAKAIAPAGLLGVAYSAAPVVSHMTYSSGPITYAY
ncbi:hypothetical protein ONE63_009334 [Megalurothrips usitatus]|uniref:Cuticle protein 76-like n=1 Tax=Megalurothrips usitatus TaxID=439358 RepID=A0AAV7XKR5_9NEOP|nr:hypothetical protein ONE63_009334 [Megalurothrips usitatus]